MPARSTSRGRGQAPSRWSDRLYSPGSRYAALCSLVAIAFLFGGGSRADIASLVALRPLAILLGAYALIVLRRDQFARLGPPTWLTLAVTLLAALQLVPLPPGLWTTLPGRELVAEISANLGLADIWRPLTLAPGRTTNTLFAMSVPLAAFALVAIQRGGDRRRLVWPLLIAGAVSALLGLLQILGPPKSGLYLYRITNPGVAVGLFANRNHNALFLASLIPLLGYVALSARAFGRRGPLVVAACGGGALFAFPLILVNGSRAGAAAALAMVAATGALWWLYHRPEAGKGSGGALERWAGALMLGGVALLAGLTYGLSRSLVSQRLLDEPLGEEMRIKAFSHLLEMIAAYFPVGSGLGSFDLAYKVIEPDELLQPQFLNQAHNDLLQLLIEGGLPAALILLAGLWWFVRAGLRSWRAFTGSARNKREGPDPAIFAFLSLGALLAGSLVDYPLRTPALMCTAVLLCCIIERGTEAPARRVLKPRA